MAYDKRLHFAAGLLVAIAVGLACAPVYGLVAAFVAGVLKEARDWFTYRDFDEKDAVFTWLGGLLGMVITGAIK